ncbi:protein Wnt-11b-like [Ctenocephalides felis]|uniref:protein Wnt-11b-like n=1 Tax=Ctenocephalides felis TaxID=7515 RepID=UPI000E6E45BA|nr:protein Wnt-11b-like [Ctenocephalides felis]
MSRLGLKHFSPESFDEGSACRQALGMSPRQTALCLAALDTMPHVARAAHLTLEACSTLLEDRRWNCSSALNAPVLGPDLARGTREQAFMYALGSAAVTLAIARACAAGELFHCSCAPPPGEPPGGNFKWGGCSDNVRWGSLFAKRFLDATERTHVTASVLHERRRRRRRRQRKLKDATKNAVIKTIAKKRKLQADPDMIKFHTRLAAMNLHNNRIGRKVVQQSQAITCKCHGVSGSCSVKTCWKALEALTVTGQKLLRKMDQAVEVAPRRLGTTTQLSGVAPVVTAPMSNQLIYLTKSPDYCEEDLSAGSFGTKRKDLFGGCYRT